MTYSLRIMLVLLLPLALAGPVAGAGDDVRQYIGFLHTATSADGIVATTTVGVGQPHTWNVTARQSILEARIGYLTQSSISNPSADFRLLWDGSPLPGCRWRIEGGTVTGARSNPTVSLYCHIDPPVEPGNHTIAVERTAVSGTPISNSVNSFVLHQRDTIPMDIDVTLHPLQSLVPILWLGIFWWACWRTSLKGPRYLGAIIFAGVGFIASALPDGTPEIAYLEGTALWGLALSIFIVALLDKFGAGANRQVKA